MSDEINIRETARGFRRAEFVDRDGIKCHLQESSLATEAAIRFGCSELGLQTLIPNKGWTPLDVPKNTVANTTMHLTQPQVHALLPLLLEFALFGTVGDVANETDATNRLAEGYAACKAAYESQ